MRQTNDKYNSTLDTLRNQTQLTSYQFLMPSDAVNSNLTDIVHFLIRHFPQETIFSAFDHQIDIPSPLVGHTNTQWMKLANCVGINVRTIEHFWKIIPYSLTLPPAQNAIHILPIWEPGVVASLYGPASWNINPAFFSPEMAHHFPHLDTVEKQLKVVINLLHVMGKVVGMDVVPHTDRYSEMVLANPQHFEWLIRKDLVITDHHADLHLNAQDNILEWLRYRGGSAVSGLHYPDNRSEFFDEAFFPESERLRVLFGEKSDDWGRLHHRNEFVNLFYQLGYETVPATMAPPYRGIEVDPDPEAKTVDKQGRIWRDYRITRPQKMSRVFGPLARFKLYESKNGNKDWELDFDSPRHATWEYVCKHYSAVQAEFGFDFMRGDMSHVQMRPEGVPENPDAYYDLLGAVKQTVLREKPYFGYFAESFLAPPNEMAYGDENDHLEASYADSTLGDIQSEPVGTGDFVQIFARYRQLLETRAFAPNFTLLTADKDDPRFDKFYLDGNELRYFMMLFLTDMPSYMGLGFECRDPHPQPAPNEHYTKLYVFHMEEGPKRTKGRYIWGRNRNLYQNIVRMKGYSMQVLNAIGNQAVRWLIAPDATGVQKVIAWTQQENPLYVFVANLDTKNDAGEIHLQLPDNWATEKVQAGFSTFSDDLNHLIATKSNLDLTIKGIKKGEGAVIALELPPPA